LQFVTKCVTIVTYSARLAKWLNPTRGRSWFFHLSWARGFFHVKNPVFFISTFNFIGFLLLHNSGTTCANRV